MIFVLDGSTPSLGQWIRIGGDPVLLGNWLLAPRSPAHCPGVKLPFLSGSLLSGHINVRALVETVSRVHLYLGSIIREYVLHLLPVYYHSAAMNNETETTVGIYPNLHPTVRSMVRRTAKVLKYC
jgi:hypothetical protein